ncbi:hypothetical protein IEQ34_003483 [Dendrobium chrysotoxum]|uniref:C2H2-type domain-containing protein n=1 Tax=Dendrobium chrysotoxum TaxID=161865 RepID=A0AAV7H2V1_DENCH|nr:hypothetical protein IEQ34_003483 [Dendrobium chrysotoxum]
MKTHVALSSLMDDKDKPVSICGLRDNLKKSRRFDDVCPEKKKDEVHAKREKVCSSLNTSFEMARYELKHDEDDDLWSGRSSDEQAEEIPSQSNSEVSLISMSVRKRKRTPRKVTKISIYSAPPALSSEYENEEMNGTHSITDILDEIPPIIEHGKKVRSYPSEDEDQPFKKPKVSCFKKNFDHGNISSHVLNVGKGSSSKQYDCKSGMYKSCKRNKYVCTICDKSFPSYQALVDHRRSHRKMKGANMELINQDCDSQTIGKPPENFESYKCSICGKAFASGQALGDHKRSHLVEGNNSASAIVISTVGSNEATHSFHPQFKILRGSENNDLLMKPHS